MPEAEELTAARAALILGESWQDQVKRLTTSRDVIRPQEGALSKVIRTMALGLDMEKGNMPANGALSATCSGALVKPAKRIPTYLEFHESGVVTKRGFHTGGHKNNPEFATPAEESYCNNGEMKSRGFHINGEGCNRNPKTPFFTQYYRDGAEMNIAHKENREGSPDPGQGYSSIWFKSDGSIANGHFIGARLTDKEPIAMIEKAKNKQLQGLCDVNFLLAGKTNQPTPLVHDDILIG